MKVKGVASITSANVLTETAEKFTDALVAEAGRYVRTQACTRLAEVVRVFKLPEVQERLKTLGLDPVLSSPAELARYQASEITKWAKVVKESGAKAQ